MHPSPNYTRTRWGCYLGLFLQAYCALCLPILFTPLRKFYGLTYSQIGAMIFILFFVQIIVDLLMSPLVHKYGYRPFALGIPFVSIAGTLVFVLAPVLMPENPKYLFYLGVLIISCAAGLIEVLVSPIIDSLPSEHKEQDMSILHGFYGIGAIFVVTVTSLLVDLLGDTNWQIIMLLFMVLPVIEFILFLKAPFVTANNSDSKGSYQTYLKSKQFYLLLPAIFFGAGMEIIMSQWASTFFTVSIGLPKLLGDLCAVGIFTLTFTLGRIGYGFFGERLNLSHLLITGSCLSFLCYLTMAISSSDFLSVIACALSGFGVSLLWPGTLSQGIRIFKNPSTHYFGAMAAAGDLGGAVLPFLVGVIADQITNPVLSLKAGMLFGAAISLVAALLHFILKKSMN